MIEGRKPRQNQVDIEQIQNFFKYSPPLCVAGLEATKSKGTRPPAFFDRHLDERLLLKRVVYLPSLAKDFKAVADRSLKDYLLTRTLPSTEINFPDLEDVKDELLSSRHLRIKDEGDVQQTYETNMTKHCLVVASTLHFQLPVWSTGYLTWTKKHQCLPGEKYAIADGFLTLAAPKRRPSGFPAQTSSLHSRIINEGLPLCIWEFKNMTAGSLTVFEAIRELTEDKVYW